MPSVALNYTYGMLFEHVYNQTGFYIVTVNANNLVSYGTFMAAILVQNMSCYRPIVSISDVSADYQSPTIMNCGDDISLNAHVSKLDFLWWQFKIIDSNQLLVDGQFHTCMVS